MRIVICAAFYPPYRGGYAESVRLLAEGLVARGSTVTVIACDTEGSASVEIMGNVVVCRVPAYNSSWLQKSFPIPSPFIFWRSLWQAKKDGIDIISTQTRFFPSSLIGFIFAKLYRIPVVHTERGARHTESDSWFVRVCAKTVDHTVGWLICRFSNDVIGVSNAACAFARHLGAHNPLTVYNGIDVDWWKRPERFMRDGDAPRIAFVGRLVHAKGVQDLFIALVPLLSEFPLLSLSIIGDGPYRAALEAHAKKLGIADAVVFHGALDFPGVRSILWQSDVFVNPSYSEGFPRSVLEAAAAGVPVVATDVGGTREIIEDGVSGLLISHGFVTSITMVLRRLIIDAPFAARMASTASVSVRHFSIEQMIAAYEKNFTAHAVL